MTEHHFHLPQQFKITIPRPNGIGTAEIIDLKTGKHVEHVRRVKIESEVGELTILTLEIMAVEANIAGTFECKQIKEEPLFKDDIQDVTAVDDVCRKHAKTDK